jgi:hypothetical protein
MNDLLENVVRRLTVLSVFQSIKHANTHTQRFCDVDSISSHKPRVITAHSKFRFNIFHASYCNASFYQIKYFDINVNPNLIRVLPPAYTVYTVRLKISGTEFYTEVPVVPSVRQLLK